MRRLSERMRRVVENVLAGMSQADAYGAVYPGNTRSSQIANGCGALRSPKVREYLLRRRAEMRAQAMRELVASRQEVLEFLTAVIRAPAGRVEEWSGLCQAFTARAGARIPGKLQAVKKLCRMMGWDRPERVKRKDALMDLIEKIRRGEGKRGVKKGGGAGM